MLVGAMAGGSASMVSQWKNHQAGQIDTNQMASNVAKSAVKAALAAGATTYVAEKMAGRPVLSMMTLLSIGVAGLYFVDQLSETDNEQQ